jgi:hypothetical protein
MSALMLSSLLALSLAAGPSTLLVWGGGKTPEEAAKSLAEWKTKSPEWLTYVQLADGYPRIIESKTVAGLNPGFHIVVLGACDDGGAGLHMLDLFKHLEPSVYAKEVTWAEASACPVPVGDWDWSSAILRVKTKQGSLSGLMLFRQKAPDMKVAIRTDIKGSASTLKWFDEGDSECELSGAFEERGSALAYETICITGRCTSNGSSKSRVSFTLKDGQIVRTVKEVEVISTMQCD